jgi:hypothetical protein
LGFGCASDAYEMYGAGEERIPGLTMSDYSVSAAEVRRRELVEQFSVG